MKHIAAGALALAISTSAFGQFVVPGNYENTPGTGVFLGPLTVGPRTYQMLIHESLLTDLVGLQLNGMTWRLPTSATGDWPASDVTYSDFDIYLSGSVTPADRSLTFSENIVGPQTQVRSGSLTIDMGTFGSGGSPNSFGQVIDFSPWLYTGGHLLVELRHTGHGSASRSVDALTSSTSGYGTLFSAAWQSSYTATSGSQGNFIITQFHAVPGPSSLIALAGLSLIGVGRRRRA